jgi:hypothetical protein
MLLMRHQRFASLAAAAAIALAAGGSAKAALIDDFSGDLSAYTNTTILDNNGGGPNTASWQITGGKLEFNTTALNPTTGTVADQNALIRNGLTLGVGQEVHADFTLGPAVNRDIGLYVGNTTPTAGVRSNFVNVYVRLLAGGEYGAIYSRGFDGNTEYPLVAAGAVPLSKLFIKRTAANTYEAGFYNGATRTVMTTRTPVNANAGGAVGFYSDARTVGVISSLDNFTIVPEPASLGIAVMGLLGLAAVRRRR